MATWQIEWGTGPQVCWFPKLGKEGIILRFKSNGFVWGCFCTWISCKKEKVLLIYLSRLKEATFWKGERAGWNCSSDSHGSVMNPHLPTLWPTCPGLVQMQYKTPYEIMPTANKFSSLEQNSISNDGWWHATAVVWWNSMAQPNISINILTM